MFSVQDPNCLAEPSMKRVILSDQANNIYAEEIPDEIYVFGTIEFNENTPINSINSETNHIDIEKDQQNQNPKTLNQPFKTDDKNEAKDDLNLKNYHQEIFQIKFQEKISLPIFYRDRWSKTNDVILYQTFKLLLQSWNIQSSDIILCNILDPTLIKIFLEELKETSNWRGSISHLIRRLIKIENNNNFSFREIRVFKRLLKLFKENKISIEYIHSHFPGKSLQTIIDFS